MKRSVLWGCSIFSVLILIYFFFPIHLEEKDNSFIQYPLDKFPSDQERDIEIRDLSHVLEMNDPDIDTIQTLLNSISPFWEKNRISTEEKTVWVNKRRNEAIVVEFGKQVSYITTRFQAAYAIPAQLKSNGYFQYNTEKDDSGIMIFQNNKHKVLVKEELVESTLTTIITIIPTM